MKKLDLEKIKVTKKKAELDKLIKKILCGKYLLTAKESLKLVKIVFNRAVEDYKRWCERTGYEYSEPSKDDSEIEDESDMCGTIYINLGTHYEHKLAEYEWHAKPNKLYRHFRTDRVVETENDLYK